MKIVQNIVALLKGRNLWKTKGKKELTTKEQRKKGEKRKQQIKEGKKKDKGKKIKEEKEYK